MTKNNYWQQKLSLWLHDPVHKMFDIRRHESLAAEIAELLDVTTPGKEIYQQADMMASGMTRASLPGYSHDAQQNGAVAFAEAPSITHPLVADCRLRLAMDKTTVADLHSGLKDLLQADLGLGKTFEQLGEIPAEDRPLSGHFSPQDSPEEWARALYLYLFFALKKRLREENVGNLGGAWDVLPADSRMPDHPLWHHLGLTSAIGSALAEDPNGEISLAVFAITPVQSFISKARKLRDHWVGSVILSYLAFVGIRHLAETMGPDHIVYPSLHDQPLVDSWLGKDFHLAKFMCEKDEVLRKHQENGTTIASFPNKFVFLCPASQVGEICQTVERAIQDEWLRTAGIVKNYLSSRLHTGSTMNELFDHQISDYWQFNHAACRLVGLSEIDALADLLAKSKWQNEYDTLYDFAGAYGTSGKAVARLYGATHSLTQSVLASAKFKPNRVRKPQQGEKCPLCGEHEVLHDYAEAGSTGAAEYRNAVREFWDNVRSRENSEGSHAQVGKNERICAICAVKRFLPRALQEKKMRHELLAHILLKDKDFPATTEVAAHRYLLELTEKVAISRADYSKLVEALHESEMEDVDDEHSKILRDIKEAGKKHGVEYGNRDKYYALLLMDGDKMGDLINGKTVTATWRDVLHQDLQERFERSSFQPQSALRNRLGEKRLLNPALHAAISDGLNSFARYGVAPVVLRLGGKLIYAGGDDICAILPLDAALEAAMTIQQSYSMGFVRYGHDGAEELIGKTTDVAGKMGMHLGKAPGISISGAIIIAHHKAPLREVLRDAHSVLDGVAKKTAGRNALAIRLQKRSGGDRDVWLKWNEVNDFCANSSNEMAAETLHTSFTRLMQGVTDDMLGASLLYRMTDLEQAIAPLATTEEHLKTNREKIIRLVQYEVGHSGKKMAKEQVRQFAERLAGLMVRNTSDTPGWYNPEAAIIARFLAAAPATRREA